MKKLNGYLAKIVTFVIVCFLLVLLATNSLTNTTESRLGNLWKSSISLETPDTSIVIIKIDNSTINKLNWPLKRNYYALLFNKLSKYNPKVIGFEIFLSNRFSFQSIYNDLLTDELNNSTKIVFGSIADGFIGDENISIADSLLLPNIPLSFNNINTGHLNYLQFNKITIPYFIKTNKKEYSFSSVIAESYSNTIPKSTLLNLNIHSDFDDFKSYELLEFFKLAETNPESLNSLKGKIVMIGVTADNLAKQINIGFNKSIPGLGVHAFAVDNILNNRSIIITYEFIPLLLVLIILISITAYADTKNIKFWLIALPLLYITFELAEVFFDISFNSLPFIILWVMLFGLPKLQHKLQTLFNKTKQVPPAKEQVIETQPVINKDEDIAIDICTDYQVFNGIVFADRKMYPVIDTIKKVSNEKATVLITGESGTGKEVVANAIHSLSERSEKPFLAVNCAALSETILESELFGHVKGAFTGAVENKPGKFEAASSGTLFLDEIGETSENFQVKLLRVLQTGEYQMVGSNEKKISQARIICATNKDLKKLVDGKKFREDLYYRIKVLTIQLPALRDRKNDIAPLAYYFAGKENKEITLSTPFVKKLIAMQWNGNIRELEAVIKRAVIYAKFESRTELLLKDLPNDISGDDNLNLEENILQTLRNKEFSHSSISETANELGGLNRNMVSEYLRGMFFMEYCKANYNLNEACKNLSNSNEQEINERVASKGKRYLNNLLTDLNKIESSNLETIKIKLSAKYKNLPSKYHQYLDLVIIKMKS